MKETRALNHSYSVASAPEASCKVGVAVRWSPQKVNERCHEIIFTMYHLVKPQVLFPFLLNGIKHVNSVSFREAGQI